MRVLVTRPQPDAARTAAKLERRGHRVIVDPVLTPEILPLPDIEAEQFSAIAFTSANAARIAGTNIAFEKLLALPVYAVGGHTAEAARVAGFHDVHDADGDAGALADLIRSELAPGTRVLHLSGEERARDLGELLRPAKIGVEVAALYRMRPATRLGPAANALAANALDAALHFSSRSAATFVALAEQQGLTEAVSRLRHFCISKAVAAPLTALGATVAVAAQPREESLTEMLDS